MAKKSRRRSKKRPGKNEGYGTWDENRPNESAPDLDAISYKDWKKITSMDVYHLYNGGWRTDKLSQQFGVGVMDILNKLTRK